jgi:hypothetical protein
VAWVHYSARGQLAPELGDKSGAKLHNEAHSKVIVIPLVSAVFPALFPSPLFSNPKVDFVGLRDRTIHPSLDTPTEAMAEVLGIVAGVAQLLDHSTRILVASSSLYSKLKNIPDEIDILKKNTQLFTDLLWMISSDFDGPINSQVHSLHVTHRVTSILHDMMKESEDLALLLEGLSAKNSSPMRRKWSAVVSATKEKEITERCCRIESFKSTLQLWYQHQSNARLRRVEQQL